MQGTVAFILLGALMLIIANTVLAVVQSFLISGQSDLELAWMFFMFSLILFQWVFLLVMTAYYLIRRETNPNRQITNWLLGFLICFFPYLFYCWADEWSKTVIRTAVINCIAFGFMLDWLYRRMIMKESSGSSVP